MHFLPTKPFKKILSLCLLSLICSTFMLPHAAFAVDIAGRIIMTRGDVKAIDDQGIMRQLKRRDSIYNHETIKTGKESKVQIRFIDNALLALKAESELNIKAYVYSVTNEEDNQVLMELVTGGFRTLTGKIGKGNKAAYKVETPVASIGIRGTLYDIQISMDKILAGVWKGGISLDTEKGRFNLGLNSNFDFGEISSSGVFKGLLTPPQAFTPPTFQDKKATRNEADLIDVPTVVGDIPNPYEKDEPPQPSEIANTIIKQGKVLILNKNLQNDPDIITELADELGITAIDIIPPDNIDDNFPNPTDPNNPPPNISPDLRLTNAEMDQLIQDNTLAILLGSDNKNLTIALNTDGTGETFFLAPRIEEDGTKIYETIRRGNATEADFTNRQPWSDQVSWGIWQGNSENPIQRYTEFNNNQDFTPLEQDLFYMTVQPATPIELNTGIIDGVMNFSTNTTGSISGQIDHIASSNIGNVTHVEAQFDLTANAGDYSISNIYLNVDVGLVHSWNMQASSGEMNGSSISIDNLTGSFVTIPTDTSTSASGTLNGLLLAPSADSTDINVFAGGFDLLTNDGLNSADGIIILQTGQ